MTYILFLIGWMSIGVITGVLAHQIVRTQEGQNLALETGASIFGAVSAGTVFYILDVPRVENFVIWSGISALAGALLLLFLLRMYTGYAGFRNDNS